ncbi:RagB/SusD family nutrient uptake outer membrane protein [Bacteroides sp. KH569_7]|uniref:RagB/SusD family nutrient uptake outer membrane protein n=2 Tax=Bacteroides TaxID=816 RepID=A0A9X2P355_9BACE|nr:RagB/SusD family nutrient uptake outer membrane protein [uncultured Bacteroides sp.]MCR6509664.1 RagB/SusD family nutrient uptake outer membrane protein [Bacteroides muris (ex Fokt et al. 2023)]
MRALISRFALFEGTWRRYHNLGDEEKYFDACIKYSEKLMQAYPDLHDNWGEMLTSNLAGMKGIILYKEYVPSEVNNYAMHLVERTSTHNIEMPQHIVDMYLCSDGNPIGTSEKYEWGKTDKTMYSTFRNRDRRLLETVAPPYEVVNHANKSWEYVDGKREYMDILGVTTYTGYGGGNGEAGKHKVFPMMNWSGNILPAVPHFFTNQGGVGFCVAKSGNYVWRLYNVWDCSLENKAEADMPIFKIDEVLLNYAEAKYEKGEFNNEVADITINKLRRQFAKIADMDVNAINNGFDPNRDPDVNPVLWEIRRERMVELMGEGFGFYDVRRWKKAEWFINKVAYGQWATKEQIGEGGTFINLETGLATTDKEQKEGYIYMYNDPTKVGKGWLDKYYLYQIPTNEIALNPNLLPNNPGW